MQYVTFFISYNDIFGSRRTFCKRTIISTFIAVSHCEEVDIVTLAVEEEEADPRIESVNWYNKQDTNYPALFCRIRIPSQVLVYLQQNNRNVSIIINI
jgi:hypothetical protein